MTKAVGGDDLASHVQKLEARITRAGEYSQVTPIEQQKKRRMEILQRLERYHQSTQLEIDYSPVSHNDAKHILARNLIIFKLLDKLSRLPQPGDEALKVLNTIFFTFIAPIMPECAFRQLQDIISELLDDLKVRDLENLTFGVRQDPFDLVNTLACEEGILPHRQKASRLFDHVAPFFEAAARAIKKLGARLQAEVVLGDYIDVAERLNFDLYYDPNDANESTKLDYLRPNDFPLLYDCIELSNLPDYRGGNLTTFLHALPILKPNGSSSIFSVCLRNAQAFPSMGYFISEYQLITSRKMLDQLTGACIESKGNGPPSLADNTTYQWYPRNNPYNRPI
ncbi:hypothetical protein DID88_007388 [Monilinia fructigena]|uniref:Uncharacterized protein n=1 Tax=Monilinia fructigena TaxID=38457 RepID=A0A395J8A3_9HELO|nr:hypothetical protein DID88_007388 [Monilinia fructigena]